MDTLGERLTVARKARGKTQESLAEIIGVSRGVIFNLEKSKTAPQLIVINAICQALKINKEWLLHGKGEMEDNSDAAKSAKILSEIRDLSEQLSEEEQRYILDIIKSYQRLAEHKEGE